MYSVSHVHINKSMFEYFIKIVRKEKKGNFMMSFKRCTAGMLPTRGRVALIFKKNGRYIYYFMAPQELFFKIIIEN